MIRNLAGLASGLAVAIATVMVIETVGNQLYPPPTGYDMTQATALTLPFETLIWPVIGWFLGALAGSWLAVRLSPERWTGWVVAGCVLVATIFNFALITHPLWMMAAGVLAPVLGGWIAQRLAAPAERAAP
ncbi:MAG TPA: hypothetical protein VMN38_04285 [Sphingomicrobium sp.]|nr:hypothetical protein [Sphingomicrobium sp.]